MSDQKTALFEFSSAIGPVYGTEDFALFLYALVKMHRPERVLELGTGVGTCAFWIAKALSENEHGALITIDDGSQWPELTQLPELQPYLSQPRQSYAEFLAGMAQRFGVVERIEFITQRVPPYPSFGGTLDMVFADYLHGPPWILDFFGEFLPQMSSVSSIFIDSASTLFPSFLLLEHLVAQFNEDHVPQQLLVNRAPEQRSALSAFVREHKFTLVHLTEVKDREQNSTAWIKIEPHDILPYPLTRMRFGRG